MMNIGIDIDDTITNTYETLLPLIAIHYGLNLDKLLARKPSYRYLKTTLEDFDVFAKDNYISVVRLAPLKHDVLEILNKLKKEGYKIIFITARNHKDFEDPYKTTFEYLYVNKVPFDKLITDVSNKAKACALEGIDLFIDDSSRNCKAVNEIGIPVLQIKTLFNKKCKNIQRVTDWNEIYKIIHKRLNIK